jgi:hypothetical protein
VTLVERGAAALVVGPHVLFERNKQFGGASQDFGDLP